MKPYILSLAAGLLVGGVYSLLGVRSPAPPAIALVGLLGILLGEQALPLARRAIARRDVVAFLRIEAANHVFGHLPGHSSSPAEDRA